MNKVYITPRSITKNGHPSLERLKNAGLELIFGPPGEQPSEEDQLRILPECIAYLAGIEPIRSNVLEHAKHLKIISRNGVGIDNIDLEAAHKQNIIIRIAAGSNSQGVAELAISLMLSAIRAIPLSNNNMKKGKWKRVLGYEIEGKTLGIIGCGNIGKRVAFLALGLKMKVLAYDLIPDKNFHPSETFQYVNLEEIFKHSDIISLHAPPGEHPIIDKHSVNKMKDGVCIINTARAGLVNEHDMLEALNSHKVSIYATDVYDSEPPRLNELITHEHTITTPHVGGYTVESIERSVEGAVDNIIAFFQLDRVDINEFQIDSLENFFYSKTPHPNEILMVWLGQAGFGFKFKDKLLFMDPYLSDFLSKKYKGKLFPHIRLMKIPILPDKISNLDYVFSSHAHSDHMDPDTLTILSHKNPECRFIVPEAETEEAIKRGIKNHQIIPANVDNTIYLTEEINVTGVAAAHETFKVNEKGQHHYLGYILQFGKVNIYHSGDCIPYEGLTKKLRSFNIHLALLPINGRDQYRLSNGIAGNFLIPEVIELCEKAHIKQLLVHHFGMFAYNTVSNEELELIKQKSSENLKVIVPKINHVYKIKRI